MNADIIVSIWSLIHLVFSDGSGKILASAGTLRHIVVYYH